MSISIADIAALLQGTNGKAVEADKPIVKASGFELIRLLNGKQFDGEAIVFRKNGEAILFEDDAEVTYGDLATVVPGGAVRKDGTKVNDYPVVWGLTQSECSAAIEYLRGLPDKPKPQGNFRPKAGNNSAKSEGLTQELLLAALQQMLGQQQPAKPVEVAPAEGHRKVARPIATDDHGNEVAESDLVPTIAEGDVVSFNGELWQVTRQGTGRPGFRKTIV